MSRRQWEDRKRALEAVKKKSLAKDKNLQRIKLRNNELEESEDRENGRRKIVKSGGVSWYE